MSQGHDVLGCDILLCLMGSVFLKTLLLEAMLWDSCKYTNISPKNWYLPIRLHNIASQNNIHFILSTVRNLNHLQEIKLENK